MSEKQFFVYIMTNFTNSVLYTGVTSNLPSRVVEHKKKLVDGFTKRYNITKLIYYEEHATAESAFLREKRLKRWKRQWKIDLIRKQNPTVEDLSLTWDP